LSFSACVVISSFNCCTVSITINCILQSSSDCHFFFLLLIFQWLCLCLIFYELYSWFLLLTFWELWSFFLTGECYHLFSVLQHP
jgi:hypothetical protein